MDNIPWSVLESVPENLPPAWQQVFEILSEPLVIVEQLLTEREITRATRAELLAYFQPLASAVEKVDETLEVLDGVAPQTWEVAYEIDGIVKPVLWELQTLHRSEERWSRAMRQAVQEANANESELKAEMIEYDLELVRKNLATHYLRDASRLSLIALRKAVGAERHLQMGEIVETRTTSVPEKRTLPAHVDPPPALPEDSEISDPTAAILRMLTQGSSDDRIKKAQQVVANNALTVDERLQQFDALIPIPPTSSAERLGQMLRVTKQAVLKTEWWNRNRKGEKESEIARRRAVYERHAEDYKALRQDRTVDER